MEHKTSRMVPASSQTLMGKSYPETSNSVGFFSATEIPHQDLLGWGRDLPLCAVYSTEHTGAWAEDSRRSWARKNSQARVTKHVN